MMRITRVGEIAEQIRGVTYEKSAASNEPQDGYLPILRAGNIQDSGLDFRDLIYVPKACISSRQTVRAGDVIIAASSGSLKVVGKAAQAKADFTGGFGAFCKVLRPSSNIEQRYFGHFFRTVDYRARMTRLAAGANINNLRSEHLNDLEIPLPPFDEQKRIAEVLDQGDELRTKRRQAIALLDDLTQSIFLDMFGHPATNPFGWRVRTIGDLIESATYGTSQKAATTGDIPVLRMGNITSSGRVDLSDLKYMQRDSVSDRYIVQPGDVLFNRTNSADLVGKTAVYRDGPQVAYAGYLVRVRANDNSHPEYLSAFLNSAYGKRVLRGMCKSIVGMANINARELKTIQIPAPPISLQKEYAQRIRDAERLRSSHKVHLAKLDSLFNSLQQRAFGGGL